MANLIQVVMLSAGANALLTTSSRGITTLLTSKENVLELVHPSVDKQHRGITGWHERRAFDDAVAAILEKFEEPPADFVTVQGVLFPLEWRPHRIQDVLKLGKDERRRGIEAGHVVSNYSF